MCQASLWYITKICSAKGLSSVAKSTVLASTQRTIS